MSVELTIPNVLHVFPVGSTVKAYLEALVDGGTPRPIGPAVDEGVVDDSGHLLFDSLPSASTGYFAAAKVAGEWRILAFNTPGPPDTIPGELKAEIEGRIDADEALAGLIAAKEASANKDADPESVDSDVRFPTTKAARAYSNARRPFVDMRDYVGFLPTGADRGAQVNAALKAAWENEKSCQHVPWQVVVAEPAAPESFLEWFGHFGRSGLKLGAASNCALVKSPRYGAGGVGGGTERTSIHHLDFDGNFAQNGGTVDPCVAIDGIRSFIEYLHIKNGVLNFRGLSSRIPVASGAVLEDSRIAHLGLLDPQKQNLLVDGPHDTIVADILGRSNVEGFPNLAVKGGSIILRDSHAYGNAQYAIELEADGRNLTAEGGRLGEILIPTTGHRLWGAHIFSAGAADGKIGVVIGVDAASNCFNLELYDLHIEGADNGALKFNTANTSGTTVTGWASGGAGSKLAVGAKEPNRDNDFRRLRTLGEMTNNLRERTVASSGAIPAGRQEILVITGKEPINTLQFGEAGDEVTLWFTEACDVVVTGNLRLGGGVKFAATANDTLTLKKRSDGNWYEVGRAVI